ncbi:MAG: outer membrane beta-barrel domain-containing protein [Pseudobdellovibrionaceae bacterium]
MLRKKKHHFDWALVVSRTVLTSLLVLSFSTEQAFSQVEDTTDYEVEQLEKTLGDKESPSDQLPSIRIDAQKPAPTLDYKSINVDQDLSKVVVLQKISMPKTERVQISGGFALITNDQFYRNFGFQVRGGYHFTEKWGVEVSALILSQGKSSDLTDLESKQRTEADELNSPRGYTGIDIYFSSVYGKVALYDRKIYPFEFYQTIGFGQMKTAVESSAGTFHASIGQLFTRSRNDGFRWDLGLYLYPESNGGKSQTSQSINLTLGWGLFVPGVKR